MLDEHGNARCAYEECARVKEKYLIFPSSLSGPLPLLGWRSEAQAKCDNNNKDEKYLKSLRALTVCRPLARSPAFYRRKVHEELDDMGKNPETCETVKNHFIKQYNVLGHIEDSSSAYIRVE